jgi:putative membrane protein
MLISMIISILLSSIAIFVLGNILPGVHVNSFGTALITAVVLGVLNAFIRPILIILTLPINILTLGLFTFVIMGFVVWLTSQLVPGFHLDSFLWCMVFAFLFALLNAFLQGPTRI